jgi:hypothetical protein
LSSCPPGSLSTTAVLSQEQARSKSLSTSPKKLKKVAMAQGPTFRPLPTSTRMPDNIGAHNVFKETSKR